MTQTQSTPTQQEPLETSYHLEGPLDVDALAPGHGGVGQAVPGAAAARHVHTLPPQVTEGLGDHQDGVVGQGRRILRIKTKRELRPIPSTAELSQGLTE